MTDESGENKMLSMSLGDLIRGFLALAFAYISYHILDYSNIVGLFFVISWIFYVFFRNSFDYSAWTSFIRIIVGFIVGILYGLVLISLMINSHTGSTNSLILAGFCAMVSAWFLLLDWFNISLGMDWFF